MRQKISTLIDPALYRRLKMESVRRNKQISEVVGEALEAYLANERPGLAGAGVVEESWGALRMPAERLRQLLETEESLLES